MSSSLGKQKKAFICKLRNKGDIQVFYTELISFFQELSEKKKLYSEEILCW